MDATDKMIALVMAIFTLAWVVVGRMVLPRSLKNMIRRRAGFHSWSYRNPYDRTCSVCKRHEVWWEVFHDGNHGHKCSSLDIEQ